MDGHLQYYQKGYELLHEMQPVIREIRDYVTQSRESYNKEQISLYKRMQDYKKQVYEESRLSLNGPYRDSAHPFSRVSNAVADVVLESAANGKVQIIRQGYLSKRSSNLRGDWKRRYFVLDSRGMLYYYRKPWSGSHGSNQLSPKKNSGTENGSGILSRWLSSHYHGGVHDERSIARHTVNLLTSTIKVDADQSDLRFCFRIISPSKNYTFQVLIPKLYQFIGHLLFLNDLKGSNAGRKCIGSDGLDGKDKWSNYLLVECPDTGNASLS